jgi:hypothetical protein
LRDRNRCNVEGLHIGSALKELDFKHRSLRFLHAVRYQYYKTLF